MRVISWSYCPIFLSSKLLTKTLLSRHLQALRATKYCANCTLNHSRSTSHMYHSAVQFNSQWYVESLWTLLVYYVMWQYQVTDHWFTLVQFQTVLISFITSVFYDLLMRISFEKKSNYRLWSTNIICEHINTFHLNFR